LIRFERKTPEMLLQDALSGNAADPGGGGYRECGSQGDNQPHRSSSQTAPRVHAPQQLLKSYGHPGVCHPPTLTGDQSHFQMTLRRLHDGANGNYDEADGAFLVTAGEHINHPAIRIVIAEDQALVRRSAALLISMDPDMEVVGQARNGMEAVELARLLQPDVILMDLHMPLKGGVAATREITRAHPATQVLVLTTLNDDETVFEAVRAGAHAYLLKDADEDELLETIRALRRGESRLTPQIARKVMDQFRRLAPPPQSGPQEGPLQHAEHPDTEPLSDKEEKVLQLIAEGMTNRQIANALFLAEGTVKNYVSRIMDKLHANTRTELAILSRKQARAD
jgi:DNA-binding NarL/FixJ family response regulator